MSDNKCPLCGWRTLGIGRDTCNICDRQFIATIPIPPSMKLPDPREDAARIAELVGVQSMVMDAPDQKAYDARHNIKAKHYLTMLHPGDTDWVIARVRERIEGKTVVEIGAGVGILALELAKYAKRVYAIEADPSWSWAFMRHLYKTKSPNLTWIMDDAASLIDTIKGDVAIVSTGSDEERLRELAGRFAPDVIMPWQDYRGGKALISNWTHRNGHNLITKLCDCIHGCALYTPGRECDVRPGESCQLRLGKQQTGEEK